MSCCAARVISGFDRSYRADVPLETHLFALIELRIYHRKYHHYIFTVYQGMQFHIICHHCTLKLGMLNLLKEKSFN